jgi:uncharacterized protein YdeI (YjbR/CyaY-like superfamily)
MADIPPRMWQVHRHMEPIFFTSPEELRAWFADHAATERELWVGYYRRATGRPSVTWPQAVDEALCVGWIDGVRKSLDDERFIQRFTPRQRRSTWSAVNIRRAHELIAEGRMQPAGLAAFERRTDDRSAIYAYEQRHHASFSAQEQAALDANTAAREFWERQPPSYRRTATYWVVSAKREETRARRLATLIEESVAGRRVGALTPPGRRSPTG